MYEPMEDMLSPSCAQTSFSDRYFPLIHPNTRDGTKNTRAISGINPWISDPTKAEFDETCFYFQKSLLDDFNLKMEDLAKEDGWKVLVEKLFSANVGFKSSDVVVKSNGLEAGDVDDMLYYKAGVLDKMMAVGGFDLETILGMFQVDTGDSGEMEFTSMKDAVKQLYLNMWNEYSQLKDHDSSLRPNILDENN